MKRGVRSLTTPIATAGRVLPAPQLERRRYRHGCEDPTRCDDRPSKCPQRRDGGLVLAEPKTRQSKRTLPMPQPMIEALRRHRQSQRKARIYAGSEWQESGLVFTTDETTVRTVTKLPAYWIQLLGTVDAMNTGGTLPAC